jgi:hypothetical protein
VDLAAELLESAGLEGIAKEARTRGALSPLEQEAVALLDSVLALRVG